MVGGGGGGGSRSARSPARLCLCPSVSGSHPSPSRTSGLGSPLVQFHILFSISLVWGRAGVGSTCNCDISLSLIFKNFYSFEFHEPRVISILSIQRADEEKEWTAVGCPESAALPLSFHWVNLIMCLLLAKDTGKCSPVLSPGK